MLWALLSEQGSECGLIRSSEQPSSLLQMGKPSAQRSNILAEGPRLGRGEAKRERAQSSSSALHSLAPGLLPAVACQPGWAATEGDPCEPLLPVGDQATSQEAGKF